jgi:hypothetical protein
LQRKYFSRCEIGIITRETGCGYDGGCDAIDDAEKEGRGVYGRDLDDACDRSDSTVSEDGFDPDD